VEGDDLLDTASTSTGSEDEWKRIFDEQDMYKIFDGSALMAIGMLMQEYVAEIVGPRPSTTLQN